MFRVIIEGVKDKDLAELLKTLAASKYHPQVDWHGPPPESTAKPNGKGHPRTGAAVNAQIMSLTGKAPAEGSIREKVCKMLQQLEKKHGIGSVTRVMLRSELKRRSMNTQVVHQLIRNGFVATDVAKGKR